MCANCLALRHEPAYERPRFGRFAHARGAPRAAPDHIIPSWHCAPCFRHSRTSDTIFYPPTHFPNWLSVYNGNLSKLFFFHRLVVILLLIMLCWFCYFFFFIFISTFVVNRMRLLCHTTFITKYIKFCVLLCKIRI